MEQFKFDEDPDIKPDNNEVVEQSQALKPKRSRFSKVMQSGLAGVLLTGAMSAEVIGGDSKSKAPKGKPVASERVSPDQIKIMRPAGYVEVQKMTKAQKLEKFGLPKIFKPQFDDLLNKSTNGITHLSDYFTMLIDHVKAQESKVINGNDYDSFCKAVFEAGQRDFNTFSSHLEEASNADLLSIAKSAQELADVLERASYDLKNDVGSTFNSHNGLNTIDYFRFRICGDLLKIYEQRVSESAKPHFSF